MGIKHIAILCNYKLMQERIGGMDYFFHAFNNALAKQAYEATWFFPNKANHFNYDLLNIIESNTQSLELTFLEYLQNSEVKFDYIFCHFVELCTPFYKKIKEISPNCKIIAVDHNPRPLGGYTLKKKISKRIKGILYAPYIDLFISVSDKTNQELVKDFGSRIKKKSIVIYNGLITERIIKRETNTEIKLRFLVTSHLRKEKGIADLLDALKRLNPQLLSSFTIDIYGEGQQKQFIENKISEYGLQETIKLLGSKSDLYTVYKDYDYLIHPSHAETFCYSVVESLLANVPVITTNGAGNILQLVKHQKNGFLFDIGNLNQLAKILNDIVSHQLKLVIHTRNEIDDQFSLNTCVNKYMQLIK